MNILVVGSGGREHALTYAFSRRGHRVWTIPGNAGTASLAEPLPGSIEACGFDNFDDLVQIAKKLHIDLTVIGPEQPLTEGIADLFQQEGLKLFGPTKEASILEGEKAWSKEFMTRHGIPTAEYVLCRTAEEAYSAIGKNCSRWGGVVIKPSGLTAGKGVIPCKNETEAVQAVKLIMEEKKYGGAGDVVVIEEFMKGKELSILAFSDGKTIVPLLPSQDHKKLGEADEGPNTGGVGAYAPAPFVTPQIQVEIDSIIAKTGKGLRDEGIEYCGVIYFGLMVTDKGVRVLEYNCRFGDPEAQVILPLMKSDLAKVMLACCNGELSADMIEWYNQYACCVVMVAEGYPFTYPTGDPISGLEHRDENIIVFHAGTKLDEKGAVVTAGGRVLGVTGIGDTLKEAVDRAYKGVRKIDFVSAFYRNDIAYQALSSFERNPV